MQKLIISKYAAFVFGILIPLGETIRRWSQLSDLSYFMYWFDDYLLGILLVGSAFLTHKNPFNGQRYLIASWGIAVGGLFISFTAHFNSSFVETSNLQSMQVATIKFVLLIVSALCMTFALARIDENRSN
jgi:hypothetical protein